MSLTYKQQINQKKQLLVKNGHPSHVLDASRIVPLEYNQAPITLQDFFTAQCKTTQVPSILVIQNHSQTSTLTVFIQPSPESDTYEYTIQPNVSEPLRFVKNWDGSTLTISNVSANGNSASLFIA